MIWILLNLTYNKVYGWEVIYDWLKFIGVEAHQDILLLFMYLHAKIASHTHTGAKNHLNYFQIQGYTTFQLNFLILINCSKQTLMLKIFNSRYVLSVNSAVSVFLTLK